MSRIALVVSDVDGTLVTKNKTLTDAAKGAVRRLREAGIGFTITSSRPAIGMSFLIEPLEITLPVGPFNGSSIVDAHLNAIDQHLIPADAARKSIDLMNEYGADIWLFTNEKWFVRGGNGEYVSHEQRTIRTDPTIIDDFAPYLSKACKIVGASSDEPRLQACEAALQKALGAEATAIRSQTYYLDVTPPGVNKGTFVEAMAKLQGISTEAIATIGDMQNDLAMFRKSGFSVAMGQATDDVKKQATCVTTSNENEGFAGAIDLILKHNAETA